MAGGSKVAVIAALVGNLLIAVTKFSAAFFTASSAMFSEGIHSLVDVGNQALLLLGLHRAKKQPDEAHPFGYSKEIYFWSFVVAILLFALGGGLSLYEGILHLSHPTELKHVYVNYIVLISACIFESIALSIAYRQFKKSDKRFHFIRSINRTKDPALMVVFLEDTAAIIGLFIALVGVSCSQILNMPILDGIASVLIGVVLLIVATWLAYESKQLLIGEAASPKVVKKIKTIVAENKGVIAVQKVLTMHLGPDDVLVNIYVDFKDGLSSQEVEDTVFDMENRIKSVLPEVEWIFIAAKSFVKNKMS